MTDRTVPFTKEHIGTGSVRFPSGAPIPSATDSSVDPYAKTRIPKEAQVEGLMFWPQSAGTYPGLVLLHESWGLNSQVKDLASRLAGEGFVVLVPNLYARQGGMVTANAGVAAALEARIKEQDLLQDINSCCEFLNTRDHVKRNIHGVIGLGMGGALAMKFACQRKRLRAAVAFYSALPGSAGLLKDLYCPLLYHRAGADTSVTDEQIEQVSRAAKEHGKRVEIRTYDHAPPAFCNETRPDSYRQDEAEQAFKATIEFLLGCFKDAK
ncbi:MAG: dienelactone hydrolase family protein [Nitrospirae bacterium]|nr:MAG: dienelactone hydrolase family protein [Nitrospirota bacterium]